MHKQYQVILEINGVPISKSMGKDPFDSKICLVFNIFR